MTPDKGFGSPYRYLGRDESELASAINELDKALTQGPEPRPGQAPAPQKPVGADTGAAAPEEDIGDAADVVRVLRSHIIMPPPEPASANPVSRLLHGLVPKRKDPYRESIEAMAAKAAHDRQAQAEIRDSVTQANRASGVAEPARPLPAPPIRTPPAPPASIPASPNPAPPATPSYQPIARPATPLAPSPSAARPASTLTPSGQTVSRPPESYLTPRITNPAPPAPPPQQVNPFAAPPQQVNPFAAPPAPAPAATSAAAPQQVNPFAAPPSFAPSPSFTAPAPPEPRAFPELPYPTDDVPYPTEQPADFDFAVPVSGATYPGSLPVPGSSTRAATTAGSTAPWATSARKAGSAQAAPHASPQLLTSALVVVFVAVSAGVLGWSLVQNHQTSIDSQMASVGETSVQAGYAIQIDRAYADSNRLIVSYRIQPPAGEQDVVAIAWAKATTSDGVALPWSDDPIYNVSPPTGVGGGLVSFLTAPIQQAPATLDVRVNVQNLQVVGQGHRTVDVDASFDFRIPFVAGRSSTPNLEATASGRAATVERVTVTATETRIFIKPSTVKPVWASLTDVNGSTVETTQISSGADGPVLVFASVPPQAGQWTLTMAEKLPAAGSFAPDVPLWRFSVQPP